MFDSITNTLHKGNKTKRWPQTHDTNSSLFDQHFGESTIGKT